MSRVSPASRDHLATVRSMLRYAGILGALPVTVLSLGTVAIASTPRVHAIVGARIATAPGQVIPRGNIVMRDGIIVAVGPNPTVPADPRVWKGDRPTGYPAPIDPVLMPAPA